MSDEDDLSELFERDPLNLSTQDTQRIIAKIREHMVRQELGPKPKAAAAPKKSSKTLDLLKDLGLG
jgi:hypothetical protein